MERLTLRGIDGDLERCLRETARRERLSLNRAAVLLMRRGAGLADGVSDSRTVGLALDHFIGRWTMKQEREVLDAVAVFESVDEGRDVPPPQGPAT